MITTKNYFNKVGNMDASQLPMNLKEGYDFVKEVTENHTTWNYYHSDADIKAAVDEYLANVSDHLKKIDSSARPNQPLSAQKTIKKKAKEAKTKNIPARISTKNAKPVEHIREEIKFIRRYVGLHNKVKSPGSILAFIKSLQRAIVQKIIRKSSPYAKEIEVIQDKLIQVYNKMKGDESFAINEKDLNRMVSIAGGEKVYPSIAVIKRFIGIQGNSDEKKIGDFIKYVENLVRTRKLQANDPYTDKVNTIYKSIKKSTDGKVSFSKAELNGLEAIVNTCSCQKSLGKIYNTGGRRLRSCNRGTYSDAQGKGACSHNKGLSGVLTAEEMANRELDLLSFFSFWHSLFGNPAKNFTMMFHGEPHNGKTIFLLKLAQYLAENFGEVLYVSSEEFASPTMTKKVNEFLNPLPSRLHFAENLQDPDLSDYQFIILDSVNDLGLKINEYKELRKQHPDKAFIFILQHTKAGDFKGGKDWEHIAEIAGEVHKGVVNLTKNRYAPKSTLDFFKQFRIQWQEPPSKQKLKAYPINGDLITTDSQHY